MNSLDLELETIEALSAKLFNPFEINNDEIYYPLCDIDPDAHHFNELNAHISQNCNYYYEHSFSSVIQNRFTSIMDLKVFALWCHINIRSQKANPKSFEICLENLQFIFSIIGITETWLNDYNCDLYSLNGYVTSLVECSEMVLAIIISVPENVRDECCCTCFSYLHKCY